MSQFLNLFDHSSPLLKMLSPLISSETMFPRIDLEKLMQLNNLILQAKKQELRLVDSLKVTEE